MSIAVFDIDGVVADVRHRVHLIKPPRHSWLRFFELAKDDPPSPEGIGWALRAAEDHQLVWLTGRPEWLRTVTSRWLERHGLPSGELLMRPDGDYRPARYYKVEVLRRLADRDIVVFVDDDPDVVRAAAAAGFTASLATWLPRSTALSDAQERAGWT